MNAQEVIDIMKIAIAEVEWNYPLDYAIAFEEAIKALEKQIPEKVVFGDDEQDDICCPEAENERLRAELDKYPVKTLFDNNSVICSKTSEDYDKLIMDISNNAIKEFAERLKSISIGLEIGDDKKFKMTVVSTVAIDKIAKEMTEVKENEK